MSATSCTSKYNYTDRRAAHRTAAATKVHEIIRYPGVPRPLSRAPNFLSNRKKTRLSGEKNGRFSNVTQSPQSVHGARIENKII